MRRLAFLGTCAAALALAAPAAPAGAATTAPSPYVVVLSDQAGPTDTVIDSLAASLGIKPKLRYEDALHGFSAMLTSAQVTALQSSPSVSYVEADTAISQAAGWQALATGDTVPVGIQRVGAASLTQVHTASNVAVAVLDSGIDLTNPDLNAVNGTNCISPGTPAQDDNGHGTHVAGTIAALDNGSTVAGVAPGTQVYAVKVLNSYGSGTMSQVICGIDWVTANAAALNIKVANMSIIASGSNDNNCGNTSKDAEHQAICRSVAAGVTYVAAAGNSKTNFYRSIPAAYPEVLTVTAMSDSDGKSGGVGPALCKTGTTEKDDQYGSYSNYASSTADQAHTIAAPGTCIVSDKPGGGTALYYGTSQAAPHVSGAVALCFGSGGASGPCAGLAPKAVIAKIRGDAQAVATKTNGFYGDPLRPVSSTKYYGYLVNAGAY